MYTAYVLTDEARDMLLEKFPPKYSKVIAHHVTVEFGVPVDSEVPDEAEVKIVGEADTGDGLQALVAMVDGSTRRPDGGTYHVTWSLEPDRYKPVDSNQLLADFSKRWKISLATHVDVEPALLK
jgi:hypothetical protein